MCANTMTCMEIVLGWVDKRVVAMFILYNKIYVKCLTAMFYFPSSR
jgi:hypothetical protein